MIGARIVGAAVLALVVASCAETPPPKKAARPSVRINDNPYPSTYVRYPGVPTLIRGATLPERPHRRCSASPMRRVPSRMRSIETA